MVSKDTTFVFLKGGCSLAPGRLKPATASHGARLSVIQAWEFEQSEQ